MQSTEPSFDDECSPWQGSPHHYQEQAGLALVEAGVQFWPWSWIVPACGTLCLYTGHLQVHQPIRLEYPSGVCVYCGGVAWTKDHLVPRGITGDAQRRNVLTVPACGECNFLIGSTAVFSITERREVAHSGLRRKHAKVLRRIDYASSELREFGPGLRPVIEQGLVEKRALMLRLSWPMEPAFDLRALQKSGIDDPYAFGLLKHAEVAA